LREWYPQIAEVGSQILRVVYKVVCILALIWLQLYW
jgi:hypothetical protein